MISLLQHLYKKYLPEWSRYQWRQQFIIIIYSSHYHYCGYDICGRLNFDVIKWKHFPRYWPFVWGIHQSLVNSPHKGQWRGALMFSLICAWINTWVNNREAGGVRRHCTHYDVAVMFCSICHELHSIRIMFFHILQSSAIMTRANLSWYYIRQCDNTGKK